MASDRGEACTLADKKQAGSKTILRSRSLSLIGEAKGAILVSRAKVFPVDAANANGAAFLCSRPGSSLRRLKFLPDYADGRQGQYFR